MTENSPKYGYIDCEFSDYYYESIQINVIQSGYYTFSSKTDIDIMRQLYKQHFNSHSSSERLLNGDDINCPLVENKFITELQSTMTYIIVVTTRSYDKTGNYSILIFGPSNVIFNHISKSNI